MDVDAEFKQGALMRLNVVVMQGGWRGVDPTHPRPPFLGEPPYTSVTLYSTHSTPSPT